MTRPWSCIEYVDAWVRKGVTFFDENRMEEAEECLNHAVQLRPQDFKAVYNRGKLRLLTGKTEEALSDLDKATSLKPQHAVRMNILLKHSKKAERK